MAAFIVKQTTESKPAPEPDTRNPAADALEMAVDTAALSFDLGMGQFVY